MPGRSMGELIEGGNLRRILDPQLVKALGHPAREHILAVLNERIASATEIGEELGVEVSTFYHHVEELERLGCIEKVETRKNRGASEHFYRATRSVYFDDAAWARLPSSLQDDLAVCTLQGIFDDAVAALGTEVFNARSDRHLSWTAAWLDSKAWHESIAVVNEALTRLRRIQAESARRLARSGEDGVPTTVAMMTFETAR